MMHKLLGPHRHALPIQAVERTRAALQVMQDIGVLAQRDILSADKTMVKHAIPAITSDLRHIEILHSRTSFQSQLPGWSTHLVPALIDNLYSILSFVTFLTTSKIAQFEQQREVRVFADGCKKMSCMCKVKAFTGFETAGVKNI